MSITQYRRSCFWRPLRPDQRSRGRRSARMSVPEFTAATCTNPMWGTRSPCPTDEPRSEACTLGKAPATQGDAYPPALVHESARARRAEIWWSDLVGIGRRPAAALSRDAAIPGLRRALAAPAPRRFGDWPAKSSLIPSPIRFCWHRRSTSTLLSSIKKHSPNGSVAFPARACTMFARR